MSNIINDGQMVELIRNEVAGAKVGNEYVLPVYNILKRVCKEYDSQILLEALHRLEVLVPGKEDNLFETVTTKTPDGAFLTLMTSLTLVCEVAFGNPSTPAFNRMLPEELLSQPEEIVYINYVLNSKDNMITEEELIDQLVVIHEISSLDSGIKNTCPERLKNREIIFKTAARFHNYINMSDIKLDYAIAG